MSQVSASQLSGGGGAGPGERAASAGGGGRRPLSRRSVRSHRSPPRRPLRPPPAPCSKSGYETAPALGLPASGPAPYLGRAPRSCLKGQRALQRRKHSRSPPPKAPPKAVRQRDLSGFDSVFSSLFLLPSPLRTRQVEDKLAPAPFDKGKCSEDAQEIFRLKVDTCEVLNLRCPGSETCAGGELKMGCPGSGCGEEFGDYDASGFGASRRHVGGSVTFY